MKTARVYGHFDNKDCFVTKYRKNVWTFQMQKNYELKKLIKKHQDQRQY